MSKQVESQLVAKAENPKTTGILQRVRSGEQGEDFQEAGSSFYESRFQANLATIPVRKAPNKTGLPDDLKAGVEALSGFSLDDVRVHYNSSKPAQLQALAYTQGTEIHVGSGQEKHLAHEAWHVVQQMQGRVKPTMQMKNLWVNDDTDLEKEASFQGANAMKIGAYSNFDMALPQRYLVSYRQNNAVQNASNLRKGNIAHTATELMVVQRNGDNEANDYPAWIKKLEETADVLVRGVTAGIGYYATPVVSITADIGTTLMSIILAIKEWYKHPETMATKLRIVFALTQLIVSLGLLITMIAVYKQSDSQESLNETKDKNVARVNLGYFVWGIIETFTLLVLRGIKNQTTLTTHITPILEKILEIGSLFLRGLEAVSNDAPESGIFAANRIPHLLESGLQAVPSEREINAQN